VDYNCKEDSVTDNLLKLFVSEVVIRYIFYLYWITHHYVKSLLFNDYEFKQDFELSDEIVWYFIINLELWLC
jgi:hypothetical protein